LNNTWIFVELSWLKIVLKGASTVQGSVKHEHSMRGGQSLWKYIIDISLDVNTQKCRQRVNKICVPFWCSSWFDNYKGKIIFSRNHHLTYDFLGSSQMIVFHKNGILGLSGCLEQPKGLHCWDIKGLFFTRWINQDRPTKICTNICT